MPGLQPGGVLRRPLQKDRREILSRGRVFAVAGAVGDRRFDNVPDRPAHNHATAVWVFRQSTAQVESRTHTAIVIYRDFFGTGAPGGIIVHSGDGGEGTNVRISPPPLEKSVT